MLDDKITYEDLQEEVRKLLKKFKQIDITREKITEKIQAKLKLPSFSVFKEKENELIEMMCNEFNVVDDKNPQVISMVVKDNHFFHEIETKLLELNSIYCQHTSSVLFDLINITSILGKLFEHLKKFHTEKRTEGVLNRRLSILDNIKNNSGDHKLELELPPEYEFIPKCIEFRIGENTVIEPFSSDYLKKYEKPFFAWVNLVFEGNSKSNKSVKFISDSKDNSMTVKSRFLNLIVYYGNLLLLEENVIGNIKEGVSLSHLSVEEIHNCSNALKNKENSSQDLCDKILHKFLSFVNSTVDRAKGIVFYGPPRTGKTYTTQKIIDFLNLYKIYPSLSAADFSHGLVGMSEKMVDAITKRTDVIPWQMCIMYIDEVDTLAPSRKSESTSNSQSSLIGQFLAVTDGNKKKHNLLMIGTTNRLEKMDQAFRERMDIKIFLGVPNFKGRQKWIDNFFTEFAKSNPNAAMIQELVRAENLSLFNSIKEKLICMTLNFSADAMKKILSQISIELMYNIEFNISFEMQVLENFICDQLQSLCKDDGIYFGKYILPKMIKNIPKKFEEDPEYCALIDFLDDIKTLSEKFWDEKCVRRINNPTGRIVIDLTVQSKTDQLQMEYFDGFECNEGAKSLLFSYMKPNMSITNYNDMISIFKSMNVGKEFFEYLEECVNEQIKIEENEKEKENYNENEWKVKTRYNRALCEFMGKLNQRKVKCYSKNGGFRNKEEVLHVLIKMALELNVDYVLYLDSSYFFSKNLLQENQIAQELTEAIEETKKYDQALIIMDLDTLWDVNKEYSDQKGNLVFSSASAYSLDDKDITFSEKIVRPTVMQICLNYLEASLESKSNIWFVSISSQTKISLTYKEKLNWPKTDYEVEIEKTIENLMKEKVCIRCNAVYTEKTNKSGECGTHSNIFLYLEAQFNYQLSQFQKETERIGTVDFNNYFKVLAKCKLFKFEEVQEMIDQNSISSNNAKWICCGKALYEKGCKPSMHTDSLEQIKKEEKEILNEIEKRKNNRQKNK